MLAKSDLMRKRVRSIALACISPAFGSLIGYILEVFLDIEIPILYLIVITFSFATFSAFYLFTKILKLPFGDVSITEYRHQLGFYLPHKAWKHVLLGCVLAACTLSGILISSLLTGRYKFDWSTVDISQILFSINPGLWEEFFYRGVIMVLLMRATRSIKRAALIQLVLFGFFHIKGFGLWAWVDVVSVMILAVAFTFSAYKTQTLVAGIVFHFLHDAFLFVPQVPGGAYIGVFENIAFYASLWLMVGVACVIIYLSSDFLGVKAEDDLYTLESVQAG